MASKKTAAAKKKKTLKKAKTAVKKAVTSAKRKLTRKKSGTKAAAPVKGAPTRTPAKRASRPARREADIPMDSIERQYTPKTSMKTGFRFDGRERQKDQNIAEMADDRWNDEDRFTNKSGDPRIGTHGRTYEPAEKKRKNIDFETE
jgi:hypothetical protein